MDPHGDGGGKDLTSPVSAEGGGSDERDSPLERRLAAAAFVGVLIVAAYLILRANRDQWFFLDDFDFLAARDGGNLGDLLRPHNGHMSLVPIVIYRCLYRVVGLRHYWPYQLTVVSLHLASAALLRIVMRRSAVDPWIATAAAALFALFGAGRTNIAWSFQIGFTGSLFFGLAYLLLSDFHGPKIGRDVAAFACAVASLLCSGVGVAMVCGVVVAVFVRRGWRVAAMHSLPLATLFGVWWLGWVSADPPGEGSNLSGTIDFLGSMVSNAFGQLAQVPGGGWFFAMLLLAAGVTVVATIGPSAALQRYALVVGLLVAAACFAFTTAAGRSGMSGAAADPLASRYVHILAALLLPALAASVARLCQVTAVPAALGAALFLVPIPGNVDKLEPRGLDRYSLGSPELVTSLARSPVRALVPTDTEPSAALPGATVAWLGTADASHKLPHLRLSPRQRADAKLMLRFEQRKSFTTRSCTPIPSARPAELQTREAIRLPPGNTVITANTKGRSEARLVYSDALFGSFLVVVEGPVRVRVGAAAGAPPPMLCR